MIDTRLKLPNGNHNVNFGKHKIKLLVSVSGGETSAMMAYIFNKRYAEYYEIIYVFANTSREDERTLIFLENIKKHWGLNIIWVEAVVHHGERKSSTHKIVDFNSAKRNGEIFTEVIKKYGIPNHTFKHCTRELKAMPIKSYVKSLGWKNYKIAIGYRADEPKRLNWKREVEDNHFYLLPRLGIKKTHVKAFFQSQPFQLGLKEWEGNCKVCYKKGRRKLLTQIADDPTVCDWINEMEILYGYKIAPTNRLAYENPPFKFFRGYESINCLMQEVKLGFERAIEKEYSNLADFNIDLDYEEECSTSCEPF